MWSALKWIKQHLVIAIPAAMGLGLAFGALADPGPLRQAILPLTILMIYPMMVSLKLGSLFGSCDVKLQGTTQLVNFLILPLVAFGLGRLFLADQPLAAFGLLLIGLLPTSGMTISWTGLAKGNVPVAIKATLIGLLLGALSAPLYSSWLMGQAVDVSVGKVALRIGLVVLAPLALGLATQLGLKRFFGVERFHSSICPRFPLLATLGVLGIVFVAMALKARAVLAHPAAVLWLLVPLIAFYLIAFSVSTLLGRTFFRRSDSVALVYGSAMRNLSVALALALTTLGKQQGAEVALIIAVAFVIQTQSAAWYGKLVDRLLGARAAGEVVA